MKTIVYVKYDDHHWFDDGLTLEELVERNRNKGGGYVVEETGILLMENEKYIVIAHEEYTNDSGERPKKTLYDKVTKLLKADILQLDKFEVKTNES